MAFLNGSVHLLHRSVPTTLHLRTVIPAEHRSAGILGNERMGTATLLRDSGIALTAHYVVIGASEIEATQLDGSTCSARVQAIDFESGIAVVAVDASWKGGVHLHPDNDLALGEDVFLVASVGDGRRVNSGAVSSIGLFEAFWEYALDGAITVTADNPGLPGGPLFDHRGRMVGVVALSQVEVGKPTLVIPAAAARAAVAEASGGGGRPRKDPRAWLGITCYALRDHVIVAGVLPESPAEAAGIGSGDLILTIDGEAIADRRSLYGRIWRHRSGERVRLRVLRQDRAMEVEVAATAIEEYFS
jgi:S1-C subfamily serine protease